MRNRVSLFGNLAGRKTNSNYSDHLTKHGFQELPSLSQNTVSELKLYFMNYYGQSNISLNDYLNIQSNNNYIRPFGVNISLNLKLINKVFTELNLIHIVEDFLNLRMEEIYFQAKIDVLLSIKGDRKLINGYDDALEFHRDIDSLYSVKAFCYLVDIKKKFGEHEIFIGSHKKLPKDLRLIKRQNYSQLSHILGHSNLKSIVGDEGYSWLEDTTTFHRGTIPVMGHRLMLSLSFNDSKFMKHIDYGDYYPLKNVVY